MWDYPHAPPSLCGANGLARCMCPFCASVSKNLPTGPHSTTTATITAMDNDTTDIERRGANARAAGLSLHDCPFFDSEVMPGRTGETIEAWSKRVEAWRRGWMLEDAVRQ